MGSQGPRRSLCVVRARNPLGNDNVNENARYLDAHVMDGYRFLMQNYRAGDRICLFGRCAIFACGKPLTWIGFQFQGFRVVHIQHGMAEMG
jgi:Uncharacterized alpha/beta hydrolase domain (DUF2235)